MNSLVRYLKVVTPIFLDRFIKARLLFNMVYFLVSH